MPFFVFDCWFTEIAPMSAVVGLLDDVANVSMLALCMMGWGAETQVRA